MCLEAFARWRFPERLLERDRKAPGLKIRPTGFAYAAGICYSPPRLPSTTRRVRGGAFREATQKVLELGGARDQVILTDDIVLEIFRGDGVTPRPELGEFRRVSHR
jgi:hypothetical protein